MCLFNLHCNIPCFGKASSTKVYKFDTLLFPGAVNSSSLQGSKRLHRSTCSHGKMRVRFVSRKQHHQKMWSMQFCVCFPVCRPQWSARCLHPMAHCPWLLWYFMPWPKSRIQRVWFGCETGFVMRQPYLECNCLSECWRLLLSRRNYS